MTTVESPMFAQTQLCEYENQGFLAGPRVLDGWEIESLCDEMQRVIDHRRDGRCRQPVLLRNLGTAERQVWQIVNIGQASESFARLARHPLIVHAAAQLTGADELFLWHDELQYRPAVVGGAHWWHQDAIYWLGRHERDEHITAWIALDDGDVEDGCAWMAPGSHRWGNAMSYLQAMREELGAGRLDDLTANHEGRPLRAVPCPVKRGQVYFHHPLTWRGSPENRSGRPRRAIALHYMTQRIVGTRHDQRTSRARLRDVDFDIDIEATRGPAFPRVWPQC